MKSLTLACCVFFSVAASSAAMAQNDAVIVDEIAANGAFAKVLEDVGVASEIISGLQGMDSTKSTLEDGVDALRSSLRTAQHELNAGVLLEVGVAISLEGVAGTLSAAVDQLDELSLAIDAAESLNFQDRKKLRRLLARAGSNLRSAVSLVNSGAPADQASLANVAGSDKPRQPGALQQEAVGPTVLSIGEEEFDALYQELLDVTYPADRTAMVVDAAKHWSFDVAQTRRLMSLFDYPRDRLSVAAAVMPKPISPEELVGLEELFIYGNDREVLRANSAAE